MLRQQDGPPHNKSGIVESHTPGTVITSHLLQRRASHYREIISQFTFREGSGRENVPGSGSNINPSKNVDVHRSLQELIK